MRTQQYASICGPACWGVSVAAAVVALAQLTQAAPWLRSPCLRGTGCLLGLGGLGLELDGDDNSLASIKRRWCSLSLAEVSGSLGLLVLGSITPRTTSSTCSARQLRCLARDSLQTQHGNRLGLVHLALEPALDPLVRAARRRNIWYATAAECDAEGSDREREARPCLLV
jgi:hypothetical protein